MGVNLFGGLALFLFGMDQMADALKAVAGERMKQVLAKLTTNRFIGALTGAFVTAVVNSSSVTTVLVVGFISAGLMSMAQSIGVIMGANIGSTITAQIVAFKATNAAMAMIAVGFGMLFIAKREKVRQYGFMIMGLGLVFFGMSVMSDAMKPLRSYHTFLDLMARMENPVVGIAVGAAFTALIQSSGATTGIVIVMASQGLVSLPAGIALAFGANIGTCVTALIAAIGKPREAMRAAMVHVLFNVFGVLIWVGFISQLADFVTWLSPGHPELTGTDRIAHEAPRQIANAHTVFNIANTLIFIWFTGLFARIVERLVPDRPERPGMAIRPRYLEDALIDTPALALDGARLEIVRMGEMVTATLADLESAFLAADIRGLEELKSRDDDLDTLHGFVVTYLGRVGQRTMIETDSQAQRHLLSVANDIESIGDLIETDLVRLGLQYHAHRLSMSPGTRDMIAALHQAVLGAVRRAVDAVRESDPVIAESVIAEKATIGKAIDAGTAKLATRLQASVPHRLELYALEVSVLEKLRRIYYFAKHIAKSVQRTYTKADAAAEASTPAPPAEPVAA
ncbi:MAG: Na/Pi cotransporter family protein [Chromatiales bacterium]|nr:Na/Pi cotransporter family protein [Chromatiales bacterium]